MTRTIEEKAFARAGLLGNPSDGYAGRTISFAFEQFFATVTATESESVVIESGEIDRLRFDSADELSQHVDQCGYYGGVRLMKSAIKQLNEYCNRKSIPFDRKFSIGYRSNIPRQVGLAGSSAIVIAALRCLCRWHEIQLTPSILASLALASETALGIAAGPQDRVIQAFQGMLFMNFSRNAATDDSPLGAFENILIRDDLRFYVAYDTSVSEPTEVLHGDLKSKMQRQDPETVAAIGEISELPVAGKSALQANDHAELANLIDRNFDLRHKVCALNAHHVRMVQTARSVGASAKYCGSGGAIVGTYRDDAMFDSLQRELGKINCQVLRPTIACPYPSP